MNDPPLTTKKFCGFLYEGMNQCFFFIKLVQPFLTHHQCRKMFCFTKQNYNFDTDSVDESTNNIDNNTTDIICDNTHN